MLPKAMMVSVSLPASTGSGTQVWVYGVASAIEAAGYSVEWCYCGTDPVRGDFDSPWPLWDRSAPTKPEVQRGVSEQLRTSRPDVVWLLDQSAWPAFAAVADEVPHVLLMGVPMAPVVRLRSKWSNAASDPVRRLVASLRASIRAREIARADAAATLGAARSGVVVGVAPGDFGDYRMPRGESAQLCPFPIAEIRRRDRVVGDAQFLLLGNFDSMHTRYGLDYFMGKVWPLWRTRIPLGDSSVRMVGGGERPPRPAIPAEDGLVVVGFVEDLAVEWEQARALLSPVPVGSGVRTRILEAWAKGVPVITHPSAIDGLPSIRDGMNALVPATPAEWITAAERLLADDDLATSLADGGYETFIRGHEAHAAAPRYGAVTAMAIDRRQK